MQIESVILQIFCAVRGLEELARPGGRSVWWNTMERAWHEFGFSERKIDALVLRHRLSGLVEHGGGGGLRDGRDENPGRLSREIAHSFEIGDQSRAGRAP